MTYEEFLTRVIDDGIAAAKKDYAKPRQRAKRDGAIEGFEACRQRSPGELGKLLAEAQQKTREAFRRVNEKEISDDEYWRTRCREAEIEWVCNCVSALSIEPGNAGRFEPIIPPTARGVMKAAEIVGVRKEQAFDG